MTKISTKKALALSLLSMLICVSMLVGSTFAWFTDTATVAVNKIQAGTLDVVLYYKNPTNGTFESAESLQALGWLQKTAPDGTTTMVTEDGMPLWEPGCTFDLPEMKIVNEGNLALKYKIVISGITGNAKLLEAIDFTVTFDGAGSTLEKLGEERQLLANANNTFTISGHMKEEAGNEYQGLSISGIAITVYATQLSYEYDSEGNDYDEKALYDLKINESANGNLPVNKENSGNATVKTATTISSGLVSVTYNPNVVLKSNTTVDGTTDKKATVAQKLNYVGDTLSTDAAGKVSINANAQAVASYELTLPVDESNTVLVPVTINYEKGLTGVVVYHSGEKLGTSSTSLNTNGEYFTYDQANGKLVLYLKHASKIDVVFDNPGVVSVTTEAEFEAALNNAEVKTVVLANDITVSKLIDLSDSRTITLDTNGKKLTCTATYGIIDLKGTSLKVVGSGTIAASYSTNKAQRVFNVSAAASTLTISDVSVETDNGFVAASDGTVIINSGSYTITGGGAAIFAYGENTKVIINGGTFTGNDESEGAVYAFNDANVVVNDGNFTFKDDETNYGLASGTTVNWTFCDYSEMPAYPFDYGGVNVTKGGHITVKGGTYNKNVSALNNLSYDATVKPTHETKLEDYNFKLEVINYVADGYEAVKNESAGTWTVSAK